MAKTVMVEVNGDALRAEIFKKNLTLSEASQKLGCSETYLNNIVRRGSMPKNKTAGIENAFGIKPEKYVFQEQQLKIETPQPESEKKPAVDGNMIRNIDVEFIRFRAHELGLPLKSFCDVMGKRDNYLYNLRTNGATKDDFERIKLVLRLEANDDRLIRKSQPVEDAPAETVEDIQTRLHKHEAKIAALQTEIKQIRALLANSKPM